MQVRERHYIKAYNGTQVNCPCLVNGNIENLTARKPSLSRNILLSELALTLVPALTSMGNRAPLY